MKTLVTIPLILAFLITNAQIHVTTTGTAENTGVDWGRATTLEHAVAAAISGQVIWVQAGTYNLTETLVVPQGVVIYGGFAGGETQIKQRNFSENPTILDANDSFAVVTLENDAVMSGFTIQNGIANTPGRMNGGGVLMRAGSRLEFSYVLNNVAANRGGGIFVEADAEIVNNVIAYNSAGIDGFAVSGEEVTFLSNTVVGNTLSLECFIPHTLVLTSEAETANQTIGVGRTIVDIAYTFGGSATAVTITWSWTGTAHSITPPDGITVSDLTVNPIVISGSPTIHDTFKYFIATRATETCSASDTLIGAITRTNFCNSNTPGWGNAGLGIITWGSTTNTDINSETNIVYGSDGRFTQEWSGAVFASACQNKTVFSGGTSGNYNADCRRAYTELTGHFFSWCAVHRFADQLCPEPWRVPTRADFRDLDLNLGGTGEDRSSKDVGAPTIAQQLEWYTAATGYGSSPKIGGIWGGARFTGAAVNPAVSWSRYWASTESSVAGVFALNFDEGGIYPQDRWGKSNGFPLRCVRDVP